MKKNTSLHLIAGLMITFVVGVSFVHGEFVQLATGDAQYCKASTICGAAPANFTLLLDFVREMMNSIKTMGTEGEYIGQYINPDRYEGNTFVTPPKQTILGKVARNVAQKLKFGLASTSIFSSSFGLGALKELAGGTVLVAKNKVFLRDSKIVEELESQVSTKRYELGLGGGWYIKINDANRAVMQAIIDKYTTKGLFNEGTVAEGTYYNNVTALLMRTLSAAKSVLYFDSVGQFDTFSKGGDDGIKIIFNPESMQIIQNDYDCARGWKDVCDTNKMTFKTVWKKLVASLKTSPYENKKIFTDALTRLGQVFSASKDEEQQKKYKAREAELLKSTYGITKRGVLIDVNYDNTDLKEVGTAIANDASAVAGAASLVAKTSAKVAVGLWKLIPKRLSDQEKEIKNIQKQAVPQIPEDSSPIGQELFNQILVASVQDVFVSQTNDSTLASFAEVKPITPAFKIIGDQILTIKNDILGGKDKAGTLIKSLGEACKAQCGGGGSCR